MDQEIKDSVARGAQLLDEKVPGWWRVVDLDTLDMHDCANCMLGQLFGHDVEKALGAKMFDLRINAKLVGTRSSFYPFEQTGYVRGYVALRDNSESATAGSFCISIGCNLARPCNDSWKDLKCEWANVIAERRAQEATDGTDGTGTSDSETSAA